MSVYLPELQENRFCQKMVHFTEIASFPNKRLSRVGARLLCILIKRQNEQHPTESGFDTDRPPRGDGWRESSPSWCVFSMGPQGSFVGVSLFNTCVDSSLENKAITDNACRCARRLETAEVTNNSAR